MPEAREEDEFEQVSGPVNQPEPRNHMNPEEFRIGEDSCSEEDPLDSNSQEKTRRGQPAQGVVNLRFRIPIIFRIPGADRAFNS
jgi:hypothetical protein